MTTEAKRIWHKGPPPHIGWWNASRVRDPDYWRWWDGKGWSWAVHKYDTSTEVCMFSNLITDSILAENIHWNDYWPENARVPRIKP